MTHDSTELNLTREEALKLHRWMWGDMQATLGDNADWETRIDYKKNWCKEHGYEDVAYNCFCCEYAMQQWMNYASIWSRKCHFCPLDWSAAEDIDINYDGSACCACYKNRGGTEYYLDAPISKILAVPKKEVSKDV